MGGGRPSGRSMKAFHSLVDSVPWLIAVVAADYRVQYGA